MTPPEPPCGRVLAVGHAGGGSASGLQADMETIAMLGGRAAIAVAVLSAGGAQSGGVLDVPAAFLRRQLDTLLADGEPGAFKTGALGDAARIEVVADAFARYAGIPLVLDPAMRGPGGVLGPQAVASLKRVLMPLARVITLTVAEAEALSGIAIASCADLEHAAEMLLTLGTPAVLLWGYGQGDTLTDILATDDGTERLVSVRTRCQPGCVLASAIATGLAQGFALRDAVVRARAYAYAGAAAGAWLREAAA